MKLNPTARLLIVPMLLTSCGTLTRMVMPSDNPESGAMLAPRSAAADSNTPSQLYSWDGSVAQGANPNHSVAIAQEPAHGIEPPEGGRSHILDLYSNAKKERDELDGEVRALQAQGQLDRDKIAELESHVATLEARNLSLMEARQALVDENLELADRLVTAQIERLQTDAVLLRDRIAAQEAWNNAKPEGSQQ